MVEDMVIKILGTAVSVRYSSRSYLWGVSTHTREHTDSMHLRCNALVLFAPSLHSTQPKSGFLGAYAESHVSLD